MLTVLYVMCSKNYSGAEIVTERLMVANRDHVLPLVLCPPGPFADRLRERGIAVVEEAALGALERGARRYTRTGLGMRVALKFARITWRMLTLLRRERPHVVHANNLAAATYLLPACLLSRGLGLGPRWIWSNHDLTYPDGQSGVRLARICHRVYERTIAVSRAVRDRYEEHGHRIVVLHNGLDPDALAFDVAARERFRTTWELDDDTVAIGIVGTIMEGKGHGLLVEAVSRLFERWTDIRLLIVGPEGLSDLPYASRLRATADHVGQGRVRFTGRLTNIQEVYSGLDIVVNATTARRQEPLGTTIYEAMSCGRIVVATRTGGSPEIIDHGVDGFLCSPDDVDALAECLGTVLVQLKTLGSIRASARDKVIRCFSIAGMCTRYNDLLAQLVPVSHAAAASVISSTAT